MVLTCLEAPVMPLKRLGWTVALVLTALLVLAFQRQRGRLGTAHSLSRQAVNVASVTGERVVRSVFHAPSA
jgi:hypothetical protein